MRKRGKSLASHIGLKIDRARSQLGHYIIDFLLDDVVAKLTSGAIDLKAYVTR